MTLTEIFLIVLPAMATSLGGIFLFYFKRKFAKYEKFEARKYNKIVLADRKIDCLIYAFKNVNGQFRETAKEMQELYDEQWTRLEKEHKLLNEEV